MKMRIERLKTVCNCMQDQKVNEKMLQFVSSVLKPAFHPDSLILIVHKILPETDKPEESKHRPPGYSEQENLSFQLKQLDKVVKKSTDSKTKEKGGQIISVIRNLRQIYNVEVYDEKNQEIPVSIHKLHELFAWYFTDCARVGFLLEISQRRSKDLQEIANLRDMLKKSELEIEKFKRDQEVPKEDSNKMITKLDLGLVNNQQTLQFSEIKGNPFTQRIFENGGSSILLSNDDTGSFND